MAKDIGKRLFFGKYRRRGFTLVEILIYIGIFSVIVTAVSFFLVWLVHSNNKIKAMREVLYSARRPLEIMTNEIRWAKGISSTSTATHLSLNRIDNTYVDFYLASSTLYQENESGDLIALTSDKVEVKNVEFKQVATDTAFPSIEISLTVEYKNPGARTDYQALISATSSVSLRNY